MYHVVQSTVVFVKRENLAWVPHLNVPERNERIVLMLCILHVCWPLHFDGTIPLFDQLEVLTFLQFKFRVYAAKYKVLGRAVTCYAL